MDFISIWLFLYAVEVVLAIKILVVCTLVVLLNFGLYNAVTWPDEDEDRYYSDNRLEQRKNLREKKTSLFKRMAYIISFISAILVLFPSTNLMYGLVAIKTGDEVYKYAEKSPMIQKAYKALEANLDKIIKDAEPKK